jgi:acyl-CoA thioesterase FadM
VQIVEVPLSLSRHAFGPRDVARPGDLWRLCQDAAIAGSVRLGWGPLRYAEAGGAFIVRRMSVVHHREIAFGQPVQARTWVSSFRRGTLSERQVRLAAGGEPLCSATQRWAYVAMPEMRPARAPAELVEAFVPGMPEGEEDIRFPAFEEAPGEESSWSFEVWHGWMDPLSHANHPVYVDWANEALHRRIAERGEDPQRLSAVAEEATWSSGAVAGERVTVTTRRLGRAGDAAVFLHRFVGGDGRELAEVLAARRLAGGDGLLWGL